MHEDPKIKRLSVKLFKDLATADEPKSDFWFESVMEIVLFGRYEFTGYGNRVSANRRILGAGQVTFLWIVAPIISLLFVLAKVAPESLVNMTIRDFFTLFFTIGGAFSGIFWKEKVAIHNKWEYLAGLYNDMCREPHAKDVSEYPKRELLRVALAFDLIVMEMWAHRSFSDLFHDCLANAIMAHTENHTASGKFMVQNLSRTRMSTATANNYLAAYQAILLKRANPIVAA